MTYETYKPWSAFKWTTSLPNHPTELLIQLEKHLGVERGTLKTLWGPQQNFSIANRKYDEVKLLRQFATECVRLGFTMKEVGYALGGSATYGHKILERFGGHITQKRGSVKPKTPKPKPYNPAKDK